MATALRSVPPPRDKATLTTTEAARIAGVSAKTLARWCDTNLLRHWVIPGAQDRRIQRIDLIEFLLRHGNPVNKADCPLVVALTQDVVLLEALAERLAGAEIASASNHRSAGVAVAKARPSAIVADWSVGEAMVKNVVAQVRKTVPTTWVYHICPDERTARGIYGHDDRASVFFRPLAYRDLALRVRASLTPTPR